MPMSRPVLAQRTNRLWHVDLLSLEILWFRFTVAAIVEGFSRRLLCLRVYPHVPRARDLVGLVGRTAREFGKRRARGYLCLSSRACPATIVTHNKKAGLHSSFWPCEAGAHISSWADSLAGLRQDEKLDRHAEKNKLPIERSISTTR